MARIDFFASKPRFSYCLRPKNRQSKSLEASEVALVVFTANRRPCVCIHNMIILYRLILKEIKTTHKLPFMPLEHSKYITEFRNYPTLIVSKVG